MIDMILIANEALEEMRKWEKEGYILKLDFEKAFDHVKWSLLDYVRIEEVWKSVEKMG
ncbi:hypothetical protein Scep_009695 [Stephania cephalantha]|uniref:Reverse transcriptase domain-containing protein n=1 Tax=Stephania cephalantha TaxID=152367 RepID=A0AAP0JUG6_9MAGN